MSRPSSSLAASIFLACCCAVMACSKQDKPSPGQTEHPRVASAAASSAPAPSASAALPAASAAPVAAGVLRKLIWTEKCEEEKAYVDCVTKACSSEYRGCYGEKVGQGGFGGPCKEYGECVLVCSLDPDEISRAACGLDCADRHMPEKGPCDQCMAKAAECAEKAGCKVPAACR